MAGFIGLIEPGQYRGVVSHSTLHKESQKNVLFSLDECPFLCHLCLSAGTEALIIIEATLRPKKKMQFQQQNNIVSLSFTAVRKATSDSCRSHCRKKPILLYVRFLNSSLYSDVRWKLTASSSERTLPDLLGDLSEPQCEGQSGWVEPRVHTFC